MGRRLLSFAVLLGSAFAVAAPAFAAPAAKEQLVDKVFVRPTPARKVEVAVYRATKADGSLIIRLVAKSGKLVIYSGGGEDDGPSDKDFRDLSFEAVEVAPKVQLLRIDFT